MIYPASQSSPSKHFPERRDLELSLWEKNIFILWQIWIRGREMDSHFCIALLFLVLRSALQVGCCVGWFHTSTLYVSMSPFASNSLITRGSPGPCGASSFGRSQQQHLLSTSELRLQQEPEVSDSPGSKRTSTVCKGQSHLRHLELYSHFFVDVYKRWRFCSHGICQFLPIVSMFWIHCTFPRLCRRRVGSSQISRKLVAGWRRALSLFPPLTIQQGKLLLFTLCAFSLVAESWSVSLCININWPW